MNLANAEMSGAALGSYLALIESAAFLAFGIAAGVVISRSRGRRLRARAAIPVLAIAGFCLALTFGVPMLFKRLFGADDVQINALFLLLGVAVPFVFKTLAGFFSPQLWIAYVKRNKNSFHEQIYDGFDKARDAYSRSLTKTIQIDPIDPQFDVESMSDQLVALKSINQHTDSRFFNNLLKSIWALTAGRTPSDNRRYDAVVIMAVDPEQEGRHDLKAREDFYAEITRLINMGVIVVSIDTKFPKERMINSDTRFLGYVTSDYGQGGRLVAHRIIDLARAGSEADCLCVLGRIDVVHEESRHKELLYELQKQQFQGRIFAANLPQSWDPEESAGLLIARVEAARIAMPNAQSVIIYACDDNIANALSKRLSRTSELAKVCFRIIGYNGQRDSNRYLIDGQPFVDSTIDTKVSEQGQAAFSMIADAFYDGGLPMRITKYTQPELKTFV